MLTMTNRLLISVISLDFANFFFKAKEKNMTGKLSYGKTGNLFCNLLQTSHVETCFANNQVLKLLKVAKSCCTKKRIVFQFCKGFTYFVLYQ